MNKILQIYNEIFENYINIFLEQNSKLNLISKNDEKFLWEKHIIDSLSIEKFFKKYDINPSGKCLLDFGTGGGLPSIPIAIRYPDLNVTALDSIRKKINAIYEIKSALNLKNLTPVCERVENISQKFDFVTARAVASIEKLLPYAIPRLKPDGYFIAYKSLKIKEELKNAESILKKFNAEVTGIIEYELNADEPYARNLLIIKQLYPQL